jgi:hypothetical protein
MFQPLNGHLHATLFKKCKLDFSHMNQCMGLRSESYNDGDMAVYRWNSVIKIVKECKTLVKLN